MPNWCYNTLTITGKPKALNKLVKEIQVTEYQVDKELLPEVTKFSFQKVIPMPKDLLENGGWYNWRVSNWGTKWSADVQYETIDMWENGEIFIDFNTAWSPAIPIIETLSKNNPKLTFFWRFNEESNAYWGIHKIKNGKYLESAEGEFNTCAEYNEFGLTHHICKMCDEWLDECNNSNEQEFVCESCTKEKEKMEMQLNDIDEGLWEGETNEATQKENAI